MSERHIEIPGVDLAPPDPVLNLLGTIAYNLRILSTQIECLIEMECGATERVVVRERYEKARAEQAAAEVAAGNGHVHAVSEPQPVDGDGNPIPTPEPHEDPDPGGHPETMPEMTSE